jgi:hypothetical protein
MSKLKGSLCDPSIVPETTVQFSNVIVLETGFAPGRRHCTRTHPLATFK